MRHRVVYGIGKAAGASWYVQASSEASERLGGGEEENTQIARFSRTSSPDADDGRDDGWARDGHDRRIMGPLCGGGQDAASGRRREPSRPRWAAVGWERG